MPDLAKSREFAAKHPDFNESLLRAHAEGHTLAVESVEHLKRTDRLDVGYWLSRPENRAMRDRLHNLAESPEEQIVELNRIAAQLDRDGTYADTTPVLSEVDQALQKRKEAIRAGRRRR
jgi:hypothetical protein